MTAHVYDITCQGNTVSSVPGSGAYVGVADNVTFIGNTISKPAATGVYVPTLVTGLSIVGNIVQSVTGNNPSGICINDGSVSNVIINTNQIVSCAGQGILDNGTNVTIVANTIRSCGGTTHVGLEINGGAGKTINSNCITNSLGGPGIQVRASVKYATVTGNTVSGSKLSGIWIDAHDVVIDGNLCINNGVGQPSNAGLFVGANNLIVSNNRCFDDQPTKTQSYGIRVFSGDNVHLTGNLLAGNLTAGLNVGTPTNLNSVPYRKIAATVGSTQTAVAHGLPYIPLSVAVSMTSAGTVWRSAPSDTTNVYLTADAANRTCDILVG